MATAGPAVIDLPAAAPSQRAEDAPSLGALSARRLLVLLAFSVFMLGSAVLLAPAVSDLPDLWARVGEGDPRWLAAAFGLEILSFLGHIVLFRAVCVDGGSRIGLRASTQITLAGHAATRLLATAGAGGMALTAWAMRRSGMARADVASRLVTFLVLLYGVYMVALVVGGVGLATGVLPGGGPLLVTLVPALFGALVIAAVLVAQRLGDRPAPRAGRVARGRALLVPVGAGVRDARALIRRGNAGLLGAIMWWGFDIAVLWACFEAFGDAPPVTVLVFAFFVGTLANTLPLPGGIGGVEGGMVGALVAFGVDPGLALLAVLGYRVFAFWLPIAPGALAYLDLRRTVARWAAEDAGEAPVAPLPRHRREGDERLCAACASA
jgi:uncharacterized membrane protein YbhN (UPF0104 family)